MTSNIRKILTTWLSRIVIRKLKGNKLKTYRKLEKINCKLIKLKAHLQFNLTCDMNNLLPIYTNIKNKYNPWRINIIHGE